MRKFLSILIMFMLCSHVAFSQKPLKRPERSAKVEKEQVVKPKKEKKSNNKTATKPVPKVRVDTVVIVESKTDTVYVERKSTNVPTARKQTAEDKTALDNGQGIGKDKMASSDDLSHYSVSELEDLGKYYIVAADKQVGDKKQKEYLLKADAVYAEMENLPDATEYAIFWRARVNTMMDPESEQALAKPYYEKLMLTIEAKVVKTETDIDRVLECYQYLAAISWLKDNDELKAYNYYQKILKYSPEDKQAKQASKVLAKSLKK